MPYSLKIDALQPKLLPGASHRNRLPQAEPESINEVCVKCLSRVCEHVVKTPTRILRKRHIEIILALAGGASNKEIATYTGMTVGTIKIYMHMIFENLGLTSRLEVALWGRDHRELLVLPNDSTPAVAA